MFVYITPLPSNAIAIAKEKTNGCHQKVLQETLEEVVRETLAAFQEGIAPSRDVKSRREAWRKENRSEAENREEEFRTPGHHCA